MEGFLEKKQTFASQDVKFHETIFPYATETNEPNYRIPNCFSKGFELDDMVGTKEPTTSMRDNKWETCSCRRKNGRPFLTRPIY